MRNPVGWFEIYVSDMPKSKSFYESVFQVKLTKLGPNDPNFEMWAFPGGSEAGGANGTICKMNGVKPGNNSTIVYFSCADCANEEKRVLEFGGKVHKSKESIGEFGFISLVYDIEGNMFGLHSMK